MDMHYKIQSIVTISAVLAIMVCVAVLINSVNPSMTGAVTKDCECKSDVECDDGNSCTEDICIYADSCASAKCLHKIIEGCYKQ